MAMNTTATTEIVESCHSIKNFFKCKTLIKEYYLDHSIDDTIFIGNVIVKLFIKFYKKYFKNVHY